ncbi:MAG TPA: Fe(2+) transporter permease subunit FeoB [Gammaproteobacteria bacterium]|nr:Fe(2+) transporter permease subunit FeoB [Gammaproteobacteria bacterium]
MGCCDDSNKPGSKGKDRSDLSSLTIAIAGNPNCGKSALFNTFTGIRQKTGNWPGVTVDRKQGFFDLQNHTVTVFDLPGIYSLDASSIDEEVTRDYLLTREANLIINVVDAANLERNLYLTAQLLEMNVPIVLVLNMMDVARKRGIDIDMKKLSQELGCPVVPVVAITGEGMDELKQEILDITSGAHSGGFRLAHDEVVEQAITDLIPRLEKCSIAAKDNLHWLALKLLESDDNAKEQCGASVLDEVTKWKDTIEERAGEEADIHIADSRFNHAHALAQSVINEKGKIGKTITDKIDNFVLSKIFGVPFFLLVMYLMFMFTINFGGAFVDFFDGIAGAIFVDGLSEILTGIGLPDFLRIILANGLGGGIQIVATFIPIITALYLFLSAVEDSGYMARAAFVMDRFMRSIGLPGKAFVPLIVGFGCNVPAIMATRTLENERERKLTILMNPFMSCGARLPVYALFVAAFFPSNGQNLVFLLYLIGITVAVLTGMLMKRTILSGESSGFMMELPPYHMPTLKGIMLRTWDRVRLFIKDAGQVIVVMVLVINVLNSIGTDGSIADENANDSVLSLISKTATPVFAPMGIEEDNWPAVLGIISGVLAKEVVVGTLDTLYTQLARQDAGHVETEAAYDFWQAIDDAVATVPENLAAISEAFTDPLQLDVGDIDSIEAAAANQAVNNATFGAMIKRFDGQAGAFAYLLFVLLYFPCVATIGAIRREAGTRWAMFVAAWTTSIAYITATSYYQISTYAQHPLFSASWLGVIIILLIGLIYGLRQWAHKGINRDINASEMGA